MSTNLSGGAATQVMQSERDRYELVAPLGKGGFGLTWRARRQSDGQTVVVKQLRVERVDDWKAVELFEREGGALAALKHPRIPAYIDSFTLADTGFVLVQAYVEGPTLQALIEQQKVPEPQVMFQWFWGMLEVCEYLHGQQPPVIHRDITPKNIILRDAVAGEAALIDFGTVQAKLISQTAVSSTAAGTFGYAPPEQFIGHATPSSDLYGLAMSFLAVALSTPPERMPMANGRVDVQAALRAAGNIDARLQLVLSDMLQADPQRRPQTARDVMQRLAPLKRAGGPSAGSAGVAGSPGQTPETAAPAGSHSAWHPAAAPAGPAGGAGEFAPDLAPQVKPWLDAWARRETIGADGWKCPPDLVSRDLSTVVFSPCGTRAFLGRHSMCWVLDLTAMRTHCLMQGASFGSVDWIAAFSADGARLLFVDAMSREAHFLDVASLDAIHTLQKFKLPGVSGILVPWQVRLALSPNHRTAALWMRHGVDATVANDQNGALVILDLQERKLTQAIGVGGSGGIEFSSDGRYILCRDSRRTKILAMAGADALLEASAVLSPDCTQLAGVSDYGKELQLGAATSLVPLKWRATIKKKLSSLAGAEGSFRSMRYSPDGRIIAIEWDKMGEKASRYLLLADAVNGEVRMTLGSPVFEGSGLDGIESFGLSADGRFAFIFGKGQVTYWQTENSKYLMCWDISATEPRFLGAIATCEEGGGGDGFHAGGTIYGVTTHGYGGSLDGDENPRAARKGRSSAPGKQPQKVREILAGRALSEVEERERAMSTDLVLRAKFFFDLVEAGRLSAHSEVRALANAAIGVTHLLPEVLMRAEADGSAPARFGDGGQAQPALAARSLQAACAQLKEMDDAMQAVVFEEMIERCRAEAVEAHALEQARLKAEHAQAARKHYVMLALGMSVVLVLLGLGTRVLLG